MIGLLLILVVLFLADWADNWVEKGRKKGD